MSPHLSILTTLSKLYISSIQPRSLFIFSAKVITPQSCGEHQKQCMNSLQASLNEKEIQWPCKKKCASSTQNFLFFLWRENFWSTEARRIKSAQYSIQQKNCFVSIHALNYSNSPSKILQSHFRHLDTVYISGKYVQLFFVSPTIVFLYFGIIFVWFLSVTAYVQHAI